MKVRTLGCGMMLLCSLIALYVARMLYGWEEVIRVIKEASGIIGILGLIIMFIVGFVLFVDPEPGE